MIWKSIKGLFRKKTVVQPMTREESQDFKNAWTSRVVPGLQQASQEQMSRFSSGYYDPYGAARVRLQKRGVEIARLRRNKKRFSHLLIEQEADQKLLADRIAETSRMMMQAR